MSKILIGQGQESNVGVMEPENAATPDRNLTRGTDALHRALWREHPRIMRKLGAVPL